MGEVESKNLAKKVICVSNLPICSRYWGVSFHFPEFHVYKGAAPISSMYKAASLQYCHLSVSVSCE